MKKIVYLIVFVCLAHFTYAQCPKTLNFDTSICAPSFSKTIDASVLKTRLCGDSITIVFNAGGSALDGDTNVYFHSGPQFVPFGGWSTPYTVGNYGQNNGVGRMKSLGSNLWSITIQPKNYYNYPADTCLDGIWMVFRNFDGTKKAADAGDQDIFLYTVPDVPTHTYPNISGTKTSAAATYLWSDNNPNAIRTFTTGGTYTVTATGPGGCTATGSVRIRTAHAPVTLGPDIIRCTPNTPVILNATTQFSSYLWLDGNFTTNSTYTATKPGCYTLLVLDTIGCPSSATVQILNTEVTGLSIPDSLSTCPGGNVTIDASTNVNKQGDSIIIIYDATKGQTGLNNAAKVYFHSGPQFTPSKGWQQNRTVGSFTQDDGIGQMTSLGNNKWRIAIDPYCYYNMNPDTLLTGIYMVFRNADGSQSGKDINGNDIFLQINNGIPNSTFEGVTATRAARTPLTYTWSNSVTGPVNNFTVANTYTVTLSDNNGCSATQSVVFSFKNAPPINLGADTTICKGGSVTLRAPADFTSYNWTTTSTAQTITVNATGTYAVTATDSVGCQSTGSRKVTLSDTTVSLGNDIFQCTASSAILSATPGFATYQWLSGTPDDETTYTATKEGAYWIKAIDHAGCISYDTVTVQYSDVLGLNMPDTVNTCPGNLLNLDASTSVELNGDSLVINYDATTGQSGLIGARKVYMHAGPQFRANQPWVVANTVGNWGQDDGIGRMDSMGNNKWRIVIQPRNYFHLHPDTALTGIFMVFRNADGSQTGRDGNGGDLYIGLNGTGIFPSFSAVYASRKSAGTISYAWSNNAAVPAIAVSAAGPYTVTVSDNKSCTNTKTIQVTNNSTLSIALGNDTTICAGQNVILNPGATFSAYHWNTGDTTKTLSVTTTGGYAVTVASGNCTATDSIQVSVRSNPVSIGNNIARCNTAPVTLTASGGFTSYLWFGKGPSSTTYTANNRGSYWVKATDATGCVSYDTVTISNSATLALLVPDTLSTCTGSAISFDAATNIAAKGDSLIITYDATKGQTGLTGAAKVYMHSGPRFSTSPNWQLGYTVGNWGQDNGVGRMTSLGNNQWRITIDPVTYFNIPPDSTLNGIFMAFRNEDGSKEGKDATGQDILLNLSGTTPTSTFNGITGTYKATGGLSYVWSNGTTTSAVNFTTSGTFYVTVSDGNSCSQVDSALVFNGAAPQFSLGADTNLCNHPTIVIEGPTGYASYKWNTNAITSSLNVSSAGTYTLTVTNTFGCTGSDAIKVDSCVTIITGCGSPTAKFSVLSVSPGNTVTFRDSSIITKVKSYDWNFGDNVTGNSIGTTVHTYGIPGSYTVTLVIEDSCGGTSTFSKVVNVNVTGIATISGIENLNIYPNPSTGIVHLSLDLTAKLDCQLVLLNLLGQSVWQKNEELPTGRHLVNIDATSATDGMYILQIISGNERISKRITITK